MQRVQHAVTERNADTVNSNNAKPSLHVMRDGTRRGGVFNNYFNNNNNYF